MLLVTLKMVTILSHIHLPQPPWTFRQRTFLSGDYFCVLLHKVCSLYFGLAPALSHYQHSGYYDNLIISDSAASFLFAAFQILVRPSGQHLKGFLALYMLSRPVTLEQ